MNKEIPEHKIGLIGELLVKIKLNDYGVNTGGVDKDTGTDVVLFKEKQILTAQVKTGKDYRRYDATHGVDLHFQVNLNYIGEDLRLDDVEVRWKWADDPDGSYRNLGPESIAEIFGDQNLA